MKDYWIVFYKKTYRHKVFSVLYTVINRCLFCGPWGTWTHDSLVMSQLLWPSELRDQICNGWWIWTTNLSGILEFPETYAANNSRGARLPFRQPVMFSRPDIDSNYRLHAYEACALPTELSGQGDNSNILKKPPQILSDVFNVFILKLYRYFICENLKPRC